LSTTSVLHGTWQYMPIRLQDFYAWLADMLHILASHPWKSFFMQMAGMDVQTDPGIPSGQGWKPPNLMHLGMEPEMY